MPLKKPTPTIHVIFPILMTVINGGVLFLTPLFYFIGVMSFDPGSTGSSEFGFFLLLTPILALASLVLVWFFRARDQAGPFIWASLLPIFWYAFLLV